MSGDTMRTLTREGIGGFFELELNDGVEFHPNAIALNTGRNAFEYILRIRGYKMVHLPFFTCNAMIEPLTRLNIPYTFYNIDENLNPIFDFGNIRDNEAFVYTNYFGLKNNEVLKISKFCKNLVVDNSQAFYSQPLEGIDTFYSPRKFFGVADGGYLYSDKIIGNYKRDKSYERMIHLLGRIDKNAESLYQKFQINENELANQPIKYMSFLTQNILKNVHYLQVAQRRKLNYNYLAERLDERNLLNIEVDKDVIPLAYPLLLNNGHKLKKNLINNKVFVPTYWPNVMTWSKNESFEYKLTENLLSLPIDQRYGTKEMEIIFNLIDNE